MGCTYVHVRPQGSMAEVQDTLRLLRVLVGAPQIPKMDILLHKSSLHSGFPDLQAADIKRH